jgi:hypothetical protein
MYAEKVHSMYQGVSAMKRIGCMISVLLLLLISIGCDASQTNPFQGQLGTIGSGGSGGTAPTNTTGTSGFETSMTTGGSMGPSTGQAGSGGATESGAGPTVLIDSGTIDEGGVGGAAGTPVVDAEVIPPPGPVATATDPAIPEITGECPNFATGNFSFMGLAGLMEVGPKGNGGGSILFFWHGTGMQANTYSALGAGIQKITSAGGIIVSPDGPAAGELGDILCSGTAIFGSTLTFSIVDQIVACAVKNYAIDPHRIYASGCSAGGLQSGCMAAQRSSYVAAVAPNSGGLVLGMGYQTTEHIPSVMTMHGAPGSDVVVLDFSSASAVLTGQITAAGGFAMDCNHGGGHCQAPADLQSAAVDYLLAHPYGVDPDPYALGIPPGFPSYCKLL